VQKTRGPPDSLGLEIVEDDMNSVLGRRADNKDEKTSWRKATTKLADGCGGERRVFGRARAAVGGMNGSGKYKDEWSRGR